MIKKTLGGGQLGVYVLDDGTFTTNAGRMFGARSARIRGAMHPVLVASGSDLLLLDSGFGPELPPNLRSHYELHRERTLMDDLRDGGYGPSDVSHVVLSHLDADHAGWALSARHFPNATVYVQRAALEEALNLPSSKGSRHEYARKMEQAIQEGWCKPLDGDEELIPGVRLEVRAGHAAGHQIAWIESRDEAMLFTADLAPSKIFLNPDLISSVDTAPEVARRNRMAVLAEAEARDAPVILYHEPSHPLVRVSRTDKGFKGVPYRG